MELFTRNAWKYSGEEEVETLIQKVVDATTVINPMTALDRDLRLKAMFREGGGKAFGLSLCGFLRSHFARKNVSLSVPSWIVCGPEDKYSSDQFQEFMKECGDGKYIVRSSTVEEDWIDIRSGVEDSKVLRNKEDVEKFM